MTTYKSVKSPLLNVFKNADPESGRVTQLKHGAVVEVLDEQIAGKKGVNTHVRFTDDKGKAAEGYVAGVYLEAPEHQTVPAATPAPTESIISAKPQEVLKPAKKASSSRKDDDPSE